jgi:hypothetical protein
MPTIIGDDTAPESVRELVGTYRYLRYDVDTAIRYLKAERAAMPRGQSTNTEDRQRWEHKCELIACLEDFLDRMKRLERKTFPASAPTDEPPAVGTPADTALAPAEEAAAADRGRPD